MNLRLACGALILMVGALLLAALPLGFLDGSNTYWVRPSGDLAEHTIGARYFLADIWRWPLLFVPALGTPDGVNIGLTDSIPLAALIAKLLHWPPQRSYFPLWIAFCYLAQGPAGAAALHAMGVRRVLPLILGGLLLVFTPFLLFRFGHAGLNGHFLLLLALAVHMRVLRGDALPRLLYLYLVLLGFSLLINIYLFAMIFAVMFASVLHGLWTGQLPLRRAFKQLVDSGCVVAAIMWMCGYLSLGPVPMKPYGEYALNLAAPLLPGPSGLFRIDTPPFGIGYESVVWVGAGVVLLMIAGLVGGRAWLRTIATTQMPTLAVMVALIVFAASYAVYLGPWMVLGIGSDTARRVVLTHAPLTMNDKIQLGLYAGLLIVLLAGAVACAWRRRRIELLVFVGILACLVVVAAIARPQVIALVISSFQASARFVWVVLYLTALLSVAAVWRAFSPRSATLLLSLALLLQIADTEPYWRTLRETAMRQSPLLSDMTELDDDIQRAERVVLIPTYLCAFAEPLSQQDHDALIARITEVEVAVSRWTKPINSVRHSRQTVTDAVGLQASCTAQRRDAAAHAGDRGILTVVLANTSLEGELGHAVAGCRVAKIGRVCAGDGTNPPR